MNNSVKKKLEYHYKAFDKTKIEPDPLQFPHKYKMKRDIEVIAFISSVFAFGNIKQIINTLNKVITKLGKHPINYILESSKRKLEKDFKGIVHRFYSDNDILIFLFLLKKIYTNYSSLEDIFYLDYDNSLVNIKIPLESFCKNLKGIIKDDLCIKKIPKGVKFMFPLPSNGSACKRMNLFLRWMVRKDELDFGLWKRIDKSKLVIPVDTHIARISKKLNLTNRKNVNWQMAEEITKNLKKYDLLDPVKYDFAICHIGMRKLEF